MSHIQIGFAIGSFVALLSVAVYVLIASGWWLHGYTTRPPTISNLLTMFALGFGIYIAFSIEVISS